MQAKMLNVLIIQSLRKISFDRNHLYTVSISDSLDNGCQTFYVKLFTLENNSFIIFC